MNEITNDQDTKRNLRWGKNTQLSWGRRANFSKPAIGSRRMRTVAINTTTAASAVNDSDRRTNRQTDRQKNYKSNSHISQFCERVYVSADTAFWVDGRYSHIIAGKAAASRIKYTFLCSNYCTLCNATSYFAKTLRHPIYTPSCKWTGTPMTLNGTVSTDNYWWKTELWLETYNLIY